MRITFLNSLYPPHGASGAETTLRFLAARLGARGHACSVVTLTPERTASTGEVDGVPVHYLPLANVYWPHGGRRPRLLRPVFQTLDAFNPVMGRRVARVLEALRPDVVNSHNLQGFSVAAWRAAARLDIPVVQTLHDYYLACPRSAMWRPARGNCATPCPECHAFAAPRRALSHVPAAVTCVSHRVFDRITAAGTFAAALAGTQPVRIIRGNNPDETPPPPPRPPGPLTLGFIGRLEPSKGLENLLDALASLPEGAARLLVAGKGPDEAYVAGLRARAARVAAGGTAAGRAGGADVTFLGHVAPAEFFPRLDLLVIPSVWEDPFPRVFHEALAYGVPSLVTPQGGLPEAIAPGRTGFIAGAATAEALRESLLGLLGPDLSGQHWDRAAMRRACRDAAALYAPDRIVGQYEAVLAAAAARRKVPDDAGEPWRPPSSHPRPLSPSTEIAHHGA